MLQASKRLLIGAAGLVAEEPERTITRLGTVDL
jgi:hypothetical protein